MENALPSLPTKAHSKATSLPNVATNRKVHKTVMPSTVQSKDSLEKLITKELPMLYRVAKRLVATQDEAEDLVGQTLVKATRGWENFDGSYPKSWLVKILKNEFLETLRRKKARPLLVEIDEAHWNSLPDGPLAVDHLEVSEVLAAVDKLPEEYRLTLVLFDVEQLTYDEIALATAVPVGTVRSRLFRARRLLRRALPAYTA